MSDKTLTVFVTFSPQARLRGMMSLKLFTAENKHLSQTIPKKTDLRKQNLVLTSWQMPMLQIPGVYRADVMLDDRTLWRGYVRITP